MEILPRRGKSIDKLLLIMLLVSLSSNCIQSYRLARDRRLLKSGFSQTTSLNLSDLKLLQANGSQVSLGKSAQPTIVYILSPTCGWCKLNENNIKALVNQIGDRYRVIGAVPVSRLGEKRLEDVHVTFPVYWMIVSNGDAYSLSGTPQTLVFKDAKLIRRWTGYYLGDSREAIEDFFQVKLPPSVPLKTHT